jgi:hypothetical protein
MFRDIDITDAAKAVWHWTTTGAQWNTPIGWIKVAAATAITFLLFLWLLGKLLETFLKVRDQYIAAGLPTLFRSHEQRVSLRRRKQFASVLRSDLATLAKTENWNDQFFTDLEAEVEAEGRFYSSLMNRLLRRRSSGLRRVSSLIEAIQTSAEQSLLLVGEPGSGKSVALRHVAHQVAELAGRSSSMDALVPLYVNLKELPKQRCTPNADLIKSFVIDNVRRGDADTAAYVTENWDDYRQRGIWFFLFDSFDEIPAVLHAPTGGSAIREHAEAIRQFLEGMSSCRGVLASRESKGPIHSLGQSFGSCLSVLPGKTN